MLQINTLTRLDLGVKQENLARDLYIDMSAWISEYPNGTITVWHKRNGDETKYAVGGVTFDRDTNILKWTPTAYDTFYTGSGLAEIRLTENDVIKKTKDIVTEVARSLMLGSGETLESGWQNIVNTVSGYASDAQDAADDAADAQDAAEDAQEAAEDAQAAAEDARDAAQAAAVHEPTIDDITGNWLVWDQDSGAYVDTGVHAQGPQGEPGSVENVRATGIKMSMLDDTTVYDAIQARADKVTGGTENNFAALDASGNLKDSGHKHSDYLTSHQDISGKADKVTGGTENNFAALDANGNLKDSGHKHSDYLTSHQDISGKADKVSSATNGNFAALDTNGNLTDSGKKASDFLTPSNIYNGLDKTTTGSALDATQGKALNDQITKVSSAYSFGNTTLSSIESAIVTYANSMDDNESVSIKFRVNPASGVFSGTTYAGTLYRNGSGVYVVTVSGIQDPTQFVNGVYTSSTWSWNSLNNNIAPTVIASGTVASTESALLTVGNALVANGDAKNIRFTISTASGLFSARDYAGTIRRRGASRYIVNASSMGSDDIEGFNDGSTWSWSSLAKSVSEKPDMVSLGSITGTSVSFTGASGTNGIVSVHGAAATRTGLYVFRITSTSMYIFPIHDSAVSTNLTATASGTTATITNSSTTSSAIVNVLYFAGNITKL